jgi:hypothetical protein
MTTTETKSSPLTIPKLKAFAKDPTFWACVKAYAMAKAFAQLERERVDAYIQPLFELYTFTVDPKNVARGEKLGEVITDMKYIWLAPDSQTTPWFAECDKEHRAHGFTGPDGACPALMAEHLQIIAENNLLQYAVPKIMPEIRDWCLHGDSRKKGLELFTSLAVQAAPSGYFKLEKQS